jgi:hypothetical protein
MKPFTFSVLLLLPQLVDEALRRERQKAAGNPGILAALRRKTRLVVARVNRALPAAALAGN